ncbi:DUF2306 domain-containing protein [Candidatus Njordibacter sp. Uisw_039]|jgi:uncharacterized membrane protein|uniref:DUF2306 domain-containing protein n=1 Tax=Candidatus Njordibacter sp. Uisw_039 TaxID=3230972 RepID=UPI003A1C9479|tara:strand:+ start:994 stop:1392 length:399 start_codon:yes stop_codon:yes gene_type:complete
MNLNNSYEFLSFVHLSTIGPAFIIATYMMLIKKGTAQHKFLGRIYMVLMLFTAMVTLFMSAQVGPTLFDHFGFIHLLSVLVLYSVPSAYFAIKAGDVKKHKLNMIGLYIGGMVVAGGFTLVPGRFLGDLIFT